MSFRIIGSDEYAVDVSKRQATTIADLLDGISFEKEHKD
jgi:hypothetical protein